MCKEGTPEMEAIVSVLERAGRYLSLIRPMDVLDVAIIAYLVYKILCLVRSTRAENILKGVAIFLVALWLSSPAALNLRGVNYILSHMVEWGVLALIILFQPEIRQLLERWAAGTFACCAFSSRSSSPPSWSGPSTRPWRPAPTWPRPARGC